MYYEITVSHEGKHLFATAERSITDKDTLRDVFTLMHSKFPESEGYKIIITKYEKVGKFVSALELWM